MAAISRRSARKVLTGVLVAACAFAAAPAAASAALTLEQPEPGARTNGTPTFSGSPGGSLTIEVDVYEGATVGETPLLKLHATPVLTEWSVATPQSEALSPGLYTVVVNGEGLLGSTEQAGPSKFTVDTQPPTVTLNAPPSRTGDTTPAFSGTASEAGTVVVHVKEGASEVAKAESPVSGGKWSTSTLSKALASGKHKYTVFATEESALGNGEGNSGSAAFEVDTEPPTVTITEPASPTNDTTPSFSGTASEATKVTVHVKEGTTEVAKAETTAAGGKWSTSTLSKALPAGKHSFTAFATEKSAIGNADGESSSVSFEVNTETPTVTIVGPPARSNDTTPSFSGTASEDTEVEVHVLQGTAEVASAKTTASGGVWSTSTLSKALPAGKHSFTAFATEKSGVGNGEGESETVTFAVDTEPPTVTISEPPERTGDTTPAFSGTASEAGTVVVHVKEGASEVAKAESAVSGGKWSTSTLSKALASGKHKYTAFATEASAIGNSPGTSGSAPFEVDTEPPTVTIKGPASPSNVTTPSFSGTASEETKVTVHVKEGTTEVAKAETTAAGGKWSTSTLSKALPTGKHSFTAFATEKSAIGNPDGQSTTVSFEVNTETPTVTIVGPPARSNNTTPSFSGTASEDTEVEVHVLQGTAEVASAKTTASGGTWSTSTLSKALPAGKHSFTAFATEKSGAGNGEGESETVTFAVDTEPPAVTISEPPERSGNTTPSFSGTASEAGTVVVHVKEGASEVAKAESAVSGGKWSTSTLSKALASGKHKYTAFATEASSIGNGQGTSSSPAFEVDTEPPTVTIKGPVSPSNVTTPSFSGTASEATKVTVHVKEGATEVAKAETTASGGKWSTSTLSKALPTGKHSFTAFATEKSAIGNPDGESSSVPFVVSTEPPQLTLEPPASPSSNTTPSFGGTSNEAGEVEIQISLNGKVISTANAESHGGSWTSSAASPALPGGKHSFTAVAVQSSAIGNGEGHSNTVAFEVNTGAPTVTLTGPPRSKNRTPTFAGTASEATEVEVHVFLGPTEVATAKTTAAGGLWSTPALSPALATGKHTYTAFATEKSAIGNPEGQSATISFEVDTEPPVVTLSGPTGRSNNATPEFSGTASEEGKVVVHVRSGSTEVAKAEATVSGGSWSVTLGKGLPSGSYTASATEASAIGNGEGKSGILSFEVETEPPTVTIVSPPSQSKNTNPSFSGTASESTEVEVHVFQGATEVAKAKTTAAGGTWSTSTLNKALPAGKHTFTAFATEKSAIGNPEGQSNTVSFEVNTEPPTVTINPPPLRSNNTSPTFSGTASENTEVIVHVFEGATEVATAKTTASGGSWSTSSLSKPLPAGKHGFTAFAIEKSGLGNADGESSTVNFEVDTTAPTVTIVAPGRSNNTKPSFSGTASENTEVTVHVFEGANEVGSVATTASGGSWSATLTKPLASGKHSFTAFATEKSGIGNSSGTSSTVPFEVDTTSPSVTLVGPPAHSNNTTPSFSGTASENTEVIVHVMEGTTEVASAKTTASGGSWSLTLSKPLTSGKHSYTATATEKSAIGNPEGTSNTVGFEVNTGAPVVTLKALPTPSNNTTPSFSGTASEETEVVVHVFEGSTEVGGAVTTASGGTWSATLTKALASGRHSYTATATEKSGLGNSEGQSVAVAFEVNTEPPSVTINQPTTPSNNKTPAFSGKAGENTEVTVHVFEGASEVASGTSTASGGNWSVASLNKPLPSGVHTFTATATEKSGLGNPDGKSAAVSFEVNTEPPVVKLTPPPLSKNTSPTFSGTASENTEVTVHVFEGGTELAKAKGIASGGTFTTGAVNKALPSGKHTFTAFATEVSGLGNEAGTSAPVNFEVNTEPPVVTLNPPAERSNNRTPSFSGTASENTEVTVHMFEGATEVSTATATAANGKWTTVGVSKALPSGTHTFTVYATEKSGLGNADGKSTPTYSFEVVSTSPTVTLTGPPTPSRDTTPAFAGTASENTEVVVHVLEGTTEVAHVATTASGGLWSAELGALPAGKHSYTAYATEKSGVGNEDGVSETVKFEVNTEPPAVTVNAPASPSKNTSPTFSGTASENTEVIVRVFEGATEMASGKATASNGSWSATLNKALPSGKHTFTASATEKSGLGNGEGHSNVVSFEVNTNPPIVTLTQPPARTSSQNPSFSGTASENTEVVVHVFEGATEVASAKTTAAGGTWSTGSLSKPLASGKHSFTVNATEVSGLGNGEGKSQTDSFEVNTEAPTVTITGPPSPSKNTTPSFAGTASEDTEVVVHVLENGSEVASVSTTASGGLWSATLGTALPNGKHSYSAYATEKSGLGNPEGKSGGSVLFEVNTEPPVVTLKPPAALSNNQNPSFSGTASESTEVVVHVFEGATEVASGKTTAASGNWSATLSKPLPAGKRSFTVYATEKSGLGNADGKSQTFPFEVNTEPPVVTVKTPTSPSNNTNPSFSGTASENTEVVVRVFEGANEVASAKTTAAGGAWSTGSLSKVLPSGKHTFTATATEKSGLGNAEGKVSTAPFEVNTEAPVVTIGQPASPSKNTTPSFSGTASENTEVTVKVMEGATEVATAKTVASGGTWSTSGTSLSRALPNGKHTFTAQAFEKSGLGNPEGKSEPTKSFEVNTEPPVVTIVQPAEHSKNTTPSFSGTASENTEVVVHVLEAGTTTQIASVATTASGGKWSTPALSPALPSGKHTFTAFATEKSGLGNADGKSETTKAFEVNTEAPVVTLERIAEVSNQTTPSFSGGASDTTPVTVEVFEGAKAEGKVVEKTTAAVSGGHWKTAPLSQALNSPVTYTAVATEPSSLENPAGRSNEVTFEVNTAAPSVLLTKPVSPSNNREPSFSGTVSGPAGKTVVAYVHEGATAGGAIVAQVETNIVNKAWSTTPIPRLPAGKHVYTVVAAVPSSLPGNPEGKSAPAELVVNTEPPVVTLKALPSRTNNPAPAFSGTASESTAVTVAVYHGAAAEGTPVATAGASAAGGTWTAPALATKLADGQYTAVATQESAINNGPGHSAPMTFTVDTKSPAVSLNEVPTPSSNRVPSFSGTAGEAGQVTVTIYRGAVSSRATASEAPVAALPAEVNGGEWVSAVAEPLEFGEYTAIASEPSAIGNPDGESKPFTFKVAKIPPGATTEAAASVNRTTAALYGSVNPLGAPVSSCNFEVGTTTAYGRTIGCALVSGASWFPTTAVGFIPVFIRIYGLAPGTTYHYRVTAASEGGSVAAADQTFTTLPNPVTPPPPPPPPSKSGAVGVASFFAAEISPTGKGARIGALLKAGLFKQHLKSPLAGTASIKWYYLPKGAKLSASKHAKVKPVLVASGNVTYKAAGTATVTIRLTPAGRALLKHASKLALTVVCSFLAPHEKAVLATGKTQLHR